LNKIVIYFFKNSFLVISITKCNTHFVFYFFVKIGYVQPAAHRPYVYFGPQTSNIFI